MPSGPGTYGPGFIPHPTENPFAVPAMRPSSGNPLPPGNIVPVEMRDLLDDPMFQELDFDGRAGVLASAIQQGVFPEVNDEILQQLVGRTNARTIMGSPSIHQRPHPSRAAHSQPQPAARPGFLENMTPAGPISNAMADALDQHSGFAGQRQSR